MNSLLEIKIDFFYFIKDSIYGKDIISYYGLGVPLSLDKTETFELANIDSFILMNTEIQFDSELSGFEMYASSPGLIQISV